MAIITEEPDSSKPPPGKPPKPPKPSSTPPPAAAAGRTANPFHFWVHFTILLSLITLIFITISYLSPQDPKSWFLSLPTSLRHHYSKGRAIKVQTAPNLPQVEVFSVQEGPFNSDSHVLIVHGLGCSSFAFGSVVKSLGLKGVHTVAIDLPGTGFSDRSMVVEEESEVTGALSRVWEFYSEIKEKGLFWGFDQLIEKGYVDYEENEVRVVRREVVKAIELGPEEMGRVLGQVIDSLGMAPVDLVLHDSALGFFANWISEHTGLVRSIMLLDGGVSSGAALPVWVVQTPVLSEVVVGLGIAFEKVIGKCCAKPNNKSLAEAHRLLLKGKDGARALAGMGKKFNHSLDLSEWGRLDGVKALPKLVIWSEDWSSEWSQEGRQVTDALPQATLVTHSGGRWPQEHNSEELAESIHQFVSSLPKSTRKAEEEQIPEHVKTMLEEAKTNGHNHHHHGHGDHHRQDGHTHGHKGYMDAYGLGGGWAV